MNNNFHVGLSAKQINVGKVTAPISGVRLQGDQTLYEVGDMTGYVFEAYCPTATKKMAEDILAKARGYTYNGYEAKTAYISPDVELGDLISIRDSYGIVARQEFSFTPKMTQHLSAPYLEEIDHEYQWNGLYSKLPGRVVKIGEFYYGVSITRKDGIRIVKTDGEIIRSIVILNSDLIAFYDDEGHEVFYFDPIKHTFRLTHYADIESALNGSEAFAKLVFDLGQFNVMIRNISGELGQLKLTADSFETRLSDLSGSYSTIKQTLDSIAFDVTQVSDENGVITAKITLKIGPNSYSGEIIMDGNVQINGQLAVDTLYAFDGDVADLTVNRLSTSRRIVKYLRKDKTDDNFITVEGEYLKFITGSTKGLVEQAKMPNGSYIYWEDNPDEALLGANGYPYKNGERIFTTTKITPWPVYIYVYEEMVKRSIGFFKRGDNYIPLDVFGIGDGNNIDTRNQGYIQKSEDSFDMWLRTTLGENHGIFIGNRFTDIVGLRKTDRLNFAEWDRGIFYAKIEGDDTNYEYKVTFDDYGRPVAITDNTGHICNITW